MGGSQRVEVFDRRIGEVNAGHPLQLIEADGVVCGGLTSAELSALEATVDVVEYRDHVLCVGLGLVDGGGQQGAGQGGLIDEDALGEPGQLRGALFTQGGLRCREPVSSRVRATTGCIWVPGHSRDCQSP